MNTEACKFDFMAKRAPCLSLVSLISPYRVADPQAGTIMYNHLQHLSHEGTIAHRETAVGEI